MRVRPSAAYPLVVRAGLASHDACCARPADKDGSCDCWPSGSYDAGVLSTGWIGPGSALPRGALGALGHAVTVCCGSLGPPGSSSHAVTFFAGLDVQALDFTEATAWFEQGRDPMAAPVPFHPSFEDRPGVPDRVFASLDDIAYQRQVAVWQSLLERVGLPDLYHIHHLTHVNDAVALWVIDPLLFTSTALS